MKIQSSKSTVLTYWLWGLFILILAMIMLGGATRLTHAGLSIIEWKPIRGIVPPLTLSDWMLEFTNYQKTPEYLLVNKGMSLDDFKFIFWMEFSHRFLGRLIGLYLVFPMVFFWIRGVLTKRLKCTSVTMLILLGFQGFLGWYMVKSGLTQDPMVSPYRLAIHLLMAFVLVGTTLNAIYHLKAQNLTEKNAGANRWSLINLSLIIITVFYGALVAGHKAGLIYNTFPLMEGQWLPSEWNFHKPLWINFFENHAMIQFMHRQLAYLVTISACIGLYKRWITQWYGIVIIGQVALGIITLLYSVPAALGTLHQGCAVIIFSIAFWTYMTNKKKSTIILK
ncbi:MAG: COX15/CtaA family protein [Candidatus Paracaedibacteraceae bacterium]|nr:COX15/CtaA family protein [Candidatus Paracaedibacteraceae bacterium]